MRSNPKIFLVATLVGALVGLLTPHLPILRRVTLQFESDIPGNRYTDTAALFDEENIGMISGDELDRLRLEYIAAARALGPRLVILNNAFFRSSDGLVAVAGDSRIAMGPVFDHRVLPSDEDLSKASIGIPATDDLPIVGRDELDARLMASSQYWGVPKLVGHDYDGMLRRMPTVFRCEEHVFPSLFLASLAAWEGVPVRSAKILLGDKISIGNLTFPIDEGGYFRLGPGFTGLYEGNYAHIEGSLLRHLVDSGTIPFPPNTRIYLSAARARNALENPVPIAELRRGIENVLNGEFFRVTTFWERLLIMIGSAGVFAFLFAIRRPILGTIVLTLGLFGHMIIAGLASERQLIMPLFPMITASFSAAFFSFALVFTRERRDRARIRSRFARYLSDGALRKLILDGDELATQGRRKEITSLFLSIPRFLETLEALPPEKSVKLVGEWMDGLSEIVFQHEATFDKIVMGSLYVFLNDPVEVPNHQEKSLAMAQALVKFTHDFIRSHAEIADLTAAVGIESGEVVVGNLGSKDYLSYTAIGDSVNVASRLSWWTEPWTIAVGPEASSKLGTAGEPAEPAESAQAALKGVETPMNVRVFRLREDAR